MRLVALAVQMYWPHVGYLQVAAAAMRCGAQFTALVYVEHWWEEQLGACTVEGIDTSSQVKRLMQTHRRTSQTAGVLPVSHRLWSTCHPCCCSCGATFG